jgi:hypothetical protein
MLRSIADMEMIQEALDRCAQYGAVPAAVTFWPTWLDDDQTPLRPSIAYNDRL